MIEVLSKVMGDANESVQVTSGQHRLEAAFSCGAKATAIDPVTSRRYELNRVDGRLKAVEIIVH